MYLKVAKIFGLIAVLVFTLAAQDAPKKNWKDREEYDLFVKITQEQAPAKKLELLNTWKEKYAATDYKQERSALYVQTYAALGKFTEVIDTSKQILETDPKDLTSLYWITEMTPKMNKTDADFLDQGEKVANSLYSNLDELFSDAKKPGPMTADQWKMARHDMEKRALRTLAWIAVQRKAYDEAEKRSIKYLTSNPNDAEVSYWMYTIIRAGGKADRRSEAFFHLARSASLSGTGEWPVAQKKQVDDFFVKAYTQYHGPDEAGLAELRKLSLASITPPEKFYIKTGSEIATEKENEFKKTNPQLAYWLGIYKELAGANGDAFWGSMKDAQIPGKIPETEYTKLKGTLISQRPAVNPKELILGMQNGTQPEVTLKLETPLRGKADPGTEIQFEGVASAFVKDPFMLTFVVENDKIVGWPAQSGAPPAKKTGGAVKKAVGKKK